MPFVDVPGQTDQAGGPAETIQLHYQDYGSGRPVVLIHGWPLSGRSWEAQVPALIDAGYRVITYDRRGFGQSSQPWSGYDYDTFAADLDVLLAHLDVRDAALVGFSMGGGEVARYFARFGANRASAAVFAAAVPPYLYKSDNNPDGGLDDATIGEFEQGVRGDRAAFLAGFVDNFFTAGDKSDLVSPGQHDFAQYLAFAASPKATLDCIAAFGRTDFRNDLAAVTVPTLVLHGDSDGVVPFEVSGKRTHEAIAGSTLVVIDGGPHGINVSHAEQFNRALIDFLASAHADATGGRHAAHDAPQAAAAPPQPVAEQPVAQQPVAQQPVAQQPVAAQPTQQAAPPPAQLPVEQPAQAPVGAQGPADRAGGEDSVAAALDSGFVWSTNEDDGVVPDDQPVEGRSDRNVADPNLGDVPVDDQQRRGEEAP